MEAPDVCRGSPCQSHNPGIGTIAGGSAQYGRLRPNRAGAHHHAVERLIEWYFGILTFAESLAHFGRQSFDMNPLCHSLLGLASVQPVVGADLRPSEMSAFIDTCRLLAIKQGS